MKWADIVLIPQSSYRRMRWKNGAGWTTEVALEPVADGAWAWRVSIAEIDADSDFSLFPGIDRTLLVLSGGGMTLDVDGGVSHTLLPLAEPLVFPGEAVIRARLVAGPTRDFNVMTRRELYAHTFALHRPGAVVRLVRTPKQSFLVYVLEGGTSGIGANVSANRAAVGTSPPAPLRPGEGRDKLPFSLDHANSPPLLEERGPGGEAPNLPKLAIMGTSGAVAGDSFLVPSGPDALVEVGGEATMIVVGLFQKFS